MSPWKSSFAGYRSKRNKQLTSLSLSLSLSLYLIYIPSYPLPATYLIYQNIQTIQIHKRSIFTSTCRVSEHDVVPYVRLAGSAYELLEYSSVTWKEKNKK